MMAMARVKSFRAEYGTSVEVRGNWHKLNCSIEIEVEPADSTEAIKERAWNTVYSEIEKQLKELLP
jgi:hypothetical protein